MNLVRENIGESSVIRIIPKIKILTILNLFRIILNSVFLILLISQERIKKIKNINYGIRIIFCDIQGEIKIFPQN
jgi:hypothetical protein